VPVRDNYTGEPVPGQPQVFVDVATARGWHDCIRVSVGGCVLLTAMEARRLALALEAAVEEVER
jgi:hypothetical protein